MINMLFKVSAGAFFFLLSFNSIASDIADTFYTNGRIYTVNEAQPWAEAVAIKDGKFLQVGSNAEIETLKGAKTEVIDLGGSFCYARGQ